MARGKNWTNEELIYLQDRWGSVSLKGIAKNIDRSVEAVRIKAQRIGLGDARTHYDGITINQLSFALNVSYSTVKTWIEKHHFPVKHKLFAVEEKVSVVTYHDFWEWAEQHKPIIDFSKLEKNILGAEPDWVDVKRQSDKISARRATQWTKEEDRLLREMVHAYRYTYPEIARALSRTEGACKRRLSELKIKARPLRQSSHIKYTEEEVRLITKMCLEGHRIDAIADEIGKTALGVRGKLDRLGFRFKNGMPVQIKS